MLPKSRLTRKLTIVSTELLAFLALNTFLNTDRMLYLLGMLLVFTTVLLIIRKTVVFRELLERSFSEEKNTAVLGVVLLAGIFPFFQASSPYNIYLITIAGIYVIMALGLDYMVGGTDLVNLGFAGFYAVGAYTAALLTTRLGWSFWSALPLAVLAAMLLGLLIGLPALKTKGYYLSLVTIAFGLIVHTLLTNMQWVGGANGIKGIPVPEIGSYSFDQPLIVLGMRLPWETNFYYFVLLAVAACIIISHWIYHSRLGLIWNAIRDDELAANCYGVNLNAGKMLAFILGSVWGGIGGAIYAPLNGYISPNNFEFFTSVMIISMVILGGMGNVQGVAVGAVLLTLLPEKFRIFSDYRMFIFGLIIVIMIIYRPQGLMPAKRRKYEEFVPFKFLKGKSGLLPGEKEGTAVETS